MSFTPTTVYSKQAGYARDMLAACTGFQAWAGEPDASRAKERIYYSRPPGPRDGVTYTAGELQGRRPYAFLYVRNFERDRTSTHTFSESGTVVIVFAREVPKSDDQFGPSEDACLQMDDELGLIIGGDPDSGTTGLCDVRQTETPSHLMFDRLRLMPKAKWISDPKWRDSQGYWTEVTLELDF